MTRLFLGLWAGLLPLSLSAQLVLAPMPNSQWPKRPLSFSDTIEAHTKIRQRLEQLQRRGYILSSADSLKFANDTLWVQLHQGKKWKWVLAELQQSNLLDLPQSLPLTPNSWTAIKEKAIADLMRPVIRLRMHCLEVLLFTGSSNWQTLRIIRFQ